MSIQEAYELGGRIPNVLDALSVGGQVTGIGLIIVFAVLIILMYVLVAMKYIFAPKEKKEKQAAVVETKKVQPQEIREEDDEELIAVITAAIAASLNTSTYNLNIKSIRRAPQSTSAWNRAGITETINSRY